VSYNAVPEFFGTTTLFKIAITNSFRHTCQAE
jgi:hypothetical protein